jgi:murein DD-endopeptidase MepM/ murein hydrolase activator NlpD
MRVRTFFKGWRGGVAGLVISAGLSLLLSTVSMAEPNPEEGESVEGTSGGIGVLGSFVRQKGKSLDTRKVDVTYDKGSRTTTVHNQRSYPITFSLDLAEAKNVATMPKRPVLKVVSPGEKIYIRFFQVGAEEPVFRYIWGWETGAYTAKHAKRVHYRLPWPTEKNFKCTQAFDGDYSHSGEHALDIVMPVGTPILAARSGRVIAITDGWGPGKPSMDYFSEANYMKILHEDGTYAVYMHLKAGGMKAGLGDEVVRGQVIATSGNSGYSKRPHLHFVVKSALDGWVTRTHAVRFQVGREVLSLRSGSWYPEKPAK